MIASFEEAGQHAQGVNRGRMFFGRLVKYASPTIIRLQNVVEKAVSRGLFFAFAGHNAVKGCHAALLIVWGAFAARVCSPRSARSPSAGPQ